MGKPSMYLQASGFCQLLTSIAAPVSVYVQLKEQTMKVKHSASVQACLPIAWSVNSNMVPCSM